MARDTKMNVRRSIRRERKRTNKGKGKGWRGSWRDRIDVPRKNGEQFLLLPGDYQDARDSAVEDNDGTPPSAAYFSYYEHNVKDRGSFNRTMCREFYDGSPCLCCKAVAEGDARVDGRRRSDQERKSKHAVNVLHFDLYHRVPATDKDGNKRRYDRDHPEGRYKRGDVIMNWEQITSVKERKAAKRNVGDLVEAGDLRLFRKGYLEVGPNHLRCIEDIDRKASAHCKCGGHLEIESFSCSECEEILVEMEETDMSLEQVGEYEDNEQKCSECKNFDFPTARYACSECDEPTPYKWDEVVAKMVKKGEGPQTIIEVVEIIPLDEFTLADGTYIIDMDEDDDGDYPVLDDNDNFKFVESVEKLATNQFNFTQILSPRSNDDMAKWLGISNPFASQGAKRYDDVRSAGKKKRAAAARDDDDDDDDDVDNDDDDDSTEERRPKRRAAKRRRARV